MLELNPYSATVEAVSAPSLVPESAPTQVHFSGAPSRTEGWVAYELATSSKARWRICGIAILVLCCLSVWPFARLFDDIGFNAVLLWLIYFVPLLVAVGIAMFIERFRERRLYRRRAGKYASVVGSIGPEGLESRSASLRSVSQWSAWCGFRAAPSVLVLFERKNILQHRVLARSQFDNESDWQCALELVAQHLPRIA